MPDFLGMSDDDFNNELPPEVTPEVAPVVEEAVAPVVTEPVVEEAVTQPVADVPADDTATNPLDAADADLVAQTAPADVALTDAEAAAAAVDEPAAADKAKAPEAEVVATDYEGFFKKVMAPFKANGKSIELKTPEEAIQLMQMGANYTRKMQEIQPHRKMLLMLENNGLLDEGKLSYLIDLDKKNPEAIKQLVKDAGIDPLDLNVSDDSAYQAGNHAVSDEESAFRSTLDVLSASAEGKATLHTINTTWDQASKELLWKDAGVMETIHQQRESGVYDLITTEVERQRTLGTIPAGTSFLHAYKAVGDYMVANKGFDSLLNKPDPADITPVAPVATRVAAAKSVVANGDKASAAAPSRSAPRPAKTVVNPLSMSDDDFLKQMENRL